MVKAALSRKQERHLVLDYLLRVPLTTLVATYGIPRQTIYRILARNDVAAERKS